jgi:radical SAM protein with 4Fe4S-binding SPASM domain
MPYQLDSNTRLRAEHQSALWFHCHTAETLELDTEGLQTLERILEGKRLWSLRSWRFFQYLWAKGFLQKNRSFNPADLLKVQTIQELSTLQSSPLRSRHAPEVLQISLTDACQQSCSGCFFSNSDPDTPNRYMSPATFERVLTEAVEQEVFQIAFGGGEPFMHPKLVEYVTRTTAAGIVANLTTNGALLTPQMAQDLKRAGLGQIQFSLNGADAAQHERTRPHHAAVLAAITLAQDSKLRWGINILVTQELLQQNAQGLHALLQFAQDREAAMVNLIRPKAAQDDAHWLDQHQPDAIAHQALQSLLKDWQRKARFALMTDTSYTFLRQGSAHQLLAAGISGCSAGRRMLSVQVDGKYSPCSHLPETMQEKGTLSQIWQHSAHLAAFRHLEDTLEGACKTCDLKSVCRGCRAVVLSEGRSFYGEDRQCPKPLSTSSWPS